MIKGMIKLFIEGADGGFVLEKQKRLKSNRGDDKDLADECGDTHKRGYIIFN